MGEKKKYEFKIFLKNKVLSFENNPLFPSTACKVFFSFSWGLSNAPWWCFRVLLFATILEPSVSPSTLKTLSFFNQEMLFSVISFIIIFPSTLLECLVCLGFFLIYWFLYFLVSAFLLLISTSLWFYFVCEPFLPYSSRTWIWFSAVTILFYSLPIIQQLLFVVLENQCFL